MHTLNEAGEPRYRDASAEVIGARSGRVAVRLQWREEPAPLDRRELFQVLTLQGGKIVTMQDYRDRRRALKALAATTR